MSSQAQTQPTQTAPLPEYRSILLAVDSSDHANRGTSEAVALASIWQSDLTAAHVYAAKLHDVRFRQMEGGLPEQFREEQELERQRDVHDDLITRGLSIITDSYLDQAERESREQNIELRRRSLEGKNYRELVNETNSGNYDLLVIGALGLGAVKSSRLGTVCQRVSRRSEIDTLVIKEPQRSIANGPIVVAVDGSAKSYGGLLTALSLAQQWQVPVKVISAFDPYYHYVAFNRIAGVLSEEAGKVFRFQEQEKLHEEIIDSGLAKIYQGHLDVAKQVAADQGIEVETTLLDGKPNDVIDRYLKWEKPSLLIIGKLGIHADEGLDIGGNAEALLNDCDCAILLSQREYQPPVEKIAAVTTSWTHEAETRMNRVPSFVRNMARMAILRYAQERGHTVITESIVEEATAQLMPGHAEDAMAEIVEAYDKGELKRKPNAEEAAPSNLHWQAAALARLMRVPEGFMRDAAKQRIEDYARAQGLSEVSLQTAEAGLAEARKAMEAQMQGDKQPAASLPEKKKSACPFAHRAQPAKSIKQEEKKPNLNWSDQAQQSMNSVPAGFCREMTVKAAETIATQRGLEQIDSDFIQQVMTTFKQGSSQVNESMPWDETARERIARAPDMVRGMLVQEIEGWARREGHERVDTQAVNAVKQVWTERGVFHLDPNDSRNQ